uniref:Uncharacterized protein n=1 Tax=Anguilla anguilla TaxID=7936 RepID=A0A0E9VZA4_ANGAN
MPGTQSKHISRLQSNKPTTAARD